MTSDPHAEEVRTWNCPKCGTLLEICGVVSVDGAEFPVFECDRDECAETWRFDGTDLPIVYIFYIDADGRPIAATDLV